MTENQKGMTARELLSRGLAEQQFDNQFRGDAAPDEREQAATEEANRRRNAERSALGFRALYASGVRALEEPVEVPAPPTPSPLPTTTKPFDPMSEEARLAREAAMDRLFAKTWPGSRSGEGQ